MTGVKRRRNNLPRWYPYRRKPIESFEEDMDMMWKRRLRDIEASVWRGEEARRWDELPGAILVQIFLRVNPCFAFNFIPCVCRSWLSSFLDMLFPNPDVIDLKSLETFPNYMRKISLRLLQILLDTRPQTQWSKLISPSTFYMKEHAILYMAQRSPCLQSLDLRLGLEFQFKSFRKAFPYWKNLKEFSCPSRYGEIIKAAPELGTHCKKITYLGLVGGLIRAVEAYAIVKNLPGLQYLNLENCSLSMAALLILDGHKNLVTINIQHTFCVEEEFVRDFVHREGDQTKYPLRLRTTAKEWSKDILEKVSDTSRYLRCEQMFCPKCSWAYQPRSGR